MIFIIKGFQTIVFIFIVISTTFWPICPSAFFRCLLNLGTFTDVVQSSMKVPEFDKHLKKARGHIGQNVEITIKMKTIVRKPLMIKQETDVDFHLSIKTTLVPRAWHPANRKLQTTKYWSTIYINYLYVNKNFKQLNMIKGTFLNRYFYYKHTFTCFYYKHTFIDFH